MVALGVVGGVWAMLMNIVERDGQVGMVFEGEGEQRRRERRERWVEGGGRWWRAFQ